MRDVNIWKLVLLLFGVPLFFLSIPHKAPATEWTQSWGRHSIDSEPASGADGIRSMDVNNDSLMDFVVGFEESGIIRIYINPGASNASEFWEYVELGGVKNVEDAFFADIDNDGMYDVIASTEGKSKKIFIFWAPSNTSDYLNQDSWTQDYFPVPKKQWMYGFSYDINNDGINDVVVGAKAKKGRTDIGWIEAPSDKTNIRNMDSWLYHKIGDVGWTMSLFPYDVDGDCKLNEEECLMDIVVTSRNGKKDVVGVRWFKNPGPVADDELWVENSISATNGGAFFAGLGDIDRDGFNDFVVPNSKPNHLTWYRRNPYYSSIDLNPSWDEFDINLPEEISNKKKPSLKAASVGDIDMDGREDIIISLAKGNNKSPGIYWIKNPEDPFYGNWESNIVSDNEGIKYDLIQVIDLDGDGDLDIVTTEENSPPKSRGLGPIWYENPLF